MMKFVSVTNPKWVDQEHSAIDVEVVFEGLGDTPSSFTARPDDGEEHGREVWTRAVAGQYGTIAEYVPPTPEQIREDMPTLTARQLRLGSLSLGKLADVPTAIAALPSPGKEQAEIEWQYASEFRRLHPLIVQLIPILGLTDEQVDAVWLQFSQV